MTQCNCEYHRIEREAKKAGSTIEAAYFVYWSTHCARCGAGIPFAGHADMPVCDKCDRETSWDCAIYRISPEAVG